MHKQNPNNLSFDRNFIFITHLNERINSEVRGALRYIVQLDLFEDHTVINWVFQEFLEGRNVDIQKCESEARLVSHSLDVNKVRIWCKMVA